MSNNYTAINGVMQLLRYTNNYPAQGTGALLYISQGHNLLGSDLPPIMVNYVQGYQNSIFGGYPDSKDVVPSAIFAAVFGVLAIMHLVVFSINFSRGHYFYLSIIWFFYCIMRFIAWVLRIKWSFDLTQIPLGLADEVLLVIPSIILVSANLILAQRLFTWRHPVGGSRPLFWNLMITLYIVVLGIIAMTVMASLIPYCHFLSEAVYTRYKKVVMASAILIILYSLTSVSLIMLSYFFKPTRKDENLYTYQPWWIESFSPFYFVPKGKAQQCEETFMKRNHNHRHAKRVIAATHHHTNMVEGLSNQRGSLKHNVSLFIIFISTLFILVGALLRCIVVFRPVYTMNATVVAKPVVMYIVWGLLEVIINLLYLIGRVDLRFYRPDVLPAKVRAIITADQTVHQSDNEEEEEEEMGFDSDLGFESADGKFGFYESPQFEKDVKRDDESEFHF